MELLKWELRKIWRPGILAAILLLGFIQLFFQTFRFESVWIPSMSKYSGRFFLFFNLFLYLL